MPLDWKRFILILAGGVSLGFAWNAFSGRGIVLGQSVLAEAGDELVKAPDAKALLDKNPNPTEHEIRFNLANNLCRCTGYDKIVRAVQAAAKELATTN